MTGNPPLSPAQVASIAQSDGRVNLWEGSIRSGKTFASLLRYFAAIATHSGHGGLLMVGRSRDTLYRNVFEPIEREPGLAFVRSHVQYRQGASSARIMGAKVNVLGANDAGAESKIRGMTVGKAYGDEVTVWAGDLFRQLLGRMSPDDAQLFATTNPDSPTHWLKQDYLDVWGAGGLPTWRSFHFTMDDNPALSDAYKAAIRAEYSGLWYDRFIRGLWVSAEGAVYGTFSEAAHVIPWAALPPMRELLAVGVDYGTSNASAAVLLGISAERDLLGRPTPRLVVVDEWRWDSKETQQRLTDVQQSRLFRQWLERPHTPQEAMTGQVELPRYVFRDPAATSFGEQLQADGLPTWLADNDVLPGIADVASLFTTGRLVVSDRCRGVIREAPGYLWDPKASAKGRDAPVKANDHSLDALRYAVRSTKSTWSRILADAYGPQAELAA